jgi:multidrug efflux pump subunit AcrB
MGPYMAPIPINASIGMLISLAVAFIVTPWLALKILNNKRQDHTEDNPGQNGLYPFFNKIVRPLLNGRQGASRRWLLMLVITFLIIASVGLAGFKLVVLKMLPFDNKSEFQIVVDMPEGGSLEQTARVVAELADYIATVPEVTDYQSYIGTAAPINFNGLLRQYYLRDGSNVGDIQVNLRDKSLRERKSHEIALGVRAPLQAIGRKYQANVKIVEVPPGPPVQAPLLAEIYGIDYAGQIEVAKSIRKVFETTDDVIDIDDSVESPSSKWIIKVDRQKAALLGLDQASIANAIATVLRGSDVTYLHSKNVKFPVPLRLEFSTADKADLTKILSLKIRSTNNVLIALSEVANIHKSQSEYSIYHKDLLPVVFVTGDMAGELDSPLYGMFDIMTKLGKAELSSALQNPIEQYLIDQPQNPYQYSLKWDGEWQVTYEVFRDLGIAFAGALLLIYGLLVAWFGSFVTPLVMMTAIPLTLIGIAPGHLAFGAFFTATSMIGMIALAGIMVRNGILLIDYLEARLEAGIPLKQAVLEAGAVRTRPIALTAGTVIIGAIVILFDPIFEGLAVALITGSLASTPLTLVVVPGIYFLIRRERPAKPDPEEQVINATDPSPA